MKVCEDDLSGKNLAITQNVVIIYPDADGQIFSNISQYFSTFAGALKLKIMLLEVVRMCHYCLQKWHTEVRLELSVTGY